MKVLLELTKGLSKQECLLHRLDNLSLIQGPTAVYITSNNNNNNLNTSIQETEAGRLL